MKLKRIRVAASLAAVALLVTTQPAFATTTLSVDGATSPAGAVTFNGTTAGLGLPGGFHYETNYGATGSCHAGSIAGSLLRGASGGIGTQVGAISGLMFDACVFTSLNFSVDISKKPTPTEWTIHLAEVPAKAQRYIKVEIRNVQMRMTSIGLPGSWITALNLAGNVKATIDTTLDLLIIDTPTLSAPNDFPLVIDALNARGDKGGSTDNTAAGEVWDGDLMSLKSTFRLNRDVAF